MKKTKPIIAAIILAATLAAPSASAQMRCQSNIFGGQDCTDLQTNQQWHTQRNIFGGQDIYSPQTGEILVCRPNIFGGVDCN